MAALIKQELSIDAALEVGGRGELSVWVNDRKVSQKDHTGFPSDRVLVAAVREGLRPA